MRFDFVTIFPRMFDPFLAEGVIARGVKQQHLDIHVWDLRDFATDKHRSTDDEAYGGGPGMVMLGEPVFRCVEGIREAGTWGGGAGPRAEGQGPGETAAAGAPMSSSAASDISLRSASASGPVHDPSALPSIILTSPQGRVFNQDVARDLASREWLVFLCGRYEGFDQRILDALQPEEISVGDFVVSGGELPAMLMADAVGRMVEGVVGNKESVEGDSFYNGLLDYPHYTRPEELRGARVPEILMSGHHENIRKWRKEQSLKATLEKRPDLLESAPLDAEAKKMLTRLRRE